MPFHFIVDIRTRLCARELGFPLLPSPPPSAENRSRRIIAKHFVDEVGVKVLADLHYLASLFGEMEYPAVAE